jgi:hypothetical protein
VVADVHGNRRVFGTVDALDGLRFDAALAKVADILKDLGDTRPRDVRRAAAVGWLANPVATLALVRRHQAWATGTQPMPWATSTITTVPDHHDDGDGGGTHLAPGLWPLDQPTPHDLLDAALWPAATVVIHLDQATWQQSSATVTAAGAADVAGHGPITAAQAFDRLRHHRVTIKPVIDLNDELHWVSGTDEFTGALREAVLLAHRWNPFPYADTETKDGDDLDHTIPRRLGGPTALGNAGPLRRRQHRHKTFAKGWRVRQPFPGIYCWASPENRIYLYDRRGHTHDLGYGQAT